MKNPYLLGKSINSLVISDETLNELVEELPSVITFLEAANYCSCTVSRLRQDLEMMERYKTNRMNKDRNQK